MDFNRMQEIEEIRVSESHFSDSISYQKLMPPDTTHKDWMERENRRLKIEEEEIKKYGKVRRYNTNR